MHNGIIPVTHTSSLEVLPDDVLGNILERLELPELVGLSCVSKRLKNRIDQFGIPQYLAHHPQNHITLNSPASTWPAATLLRHNVYINRSLLKHQWQALQVGSTWPSSVIPALSLAPDRVIYGVGGRIEVHDLVPPNRANGNFGTKSARRGIEYHVARKWAGSAADIIGVAELNDPSQQIVVAQFDGTLQRMSIPPPNSEEPRTIRSTAHYHHPPGSSVHTLATSGDNIMTTTSTGLVSLFKASSPWTKPISLQLKQSSRAWSSLLSTNSIVEPCLMIGVSRTIDVHYLDATGVPSPTPTQQLIGSDTSRASPYDLCLAPSTSVHHPKTLLSAWYDSCIRLHDLRSSSARPTLTFHDPWADSPMYSCCFTGEYHIVGGGARHGLLGIWDTRFPKTGNGWSLFTPGGKGSPVYKLQGEGGRIWGVTEKRGFMLAFDGSGNEENGMVMENARNSQAGVRGRPTEVPTKFRSRGGKWGWSVRYQQEEDRAEELGMGYLHRDKVVKLFDSLPVR